MTPGDENKADKQGVAHTRKTDLSALKPQKLWVLLKTLQLNDYVGIMES